MQVRVFKQDGGLFTVLCQPAPRLGIMPVAMQGLKKEEIEAAVLEIATRVDARKAALRAVKLSPTGG